MTSAGRRSCFEGANAYFARHGVFVLVTGALAVVANFLRLSEFGFYEDDWYYCAQAFIYTPQEWFGQLLNSVRNFYAGRPVQEIFLYMFSWVGAALGSPVALYLEAAVLLVLASVLMYHVLRLRYPVFFALFASLLFSISPLTTIRQHLNGTLWSAPAFILLFTAFLLYGRGLRAAAFLPAVAALMTYEPVGLLFLAAPVFERRRRRLRRLVAHCAAFGLLLGIYILIRAKLGEPRLNESLAGFGWNSIWQVLKYDLLYSIQSFRSYIFACHFGLVNKSSSTLWWTALTGGLIFLRLKSMPALFSAWRRRPASMPRAKFFWWLRRAALPSLGLILLGYALTYFTLPRQLLYPFAGRDTRVSLAASFGSSMLAVSLVYLALLLSPQRWWRRVVAITALAVSLMVLRFSFVVQEDYAKAWSDHKNLLLQMVLLSHDISPDSLLLIERLPPSAGRPASINTQPHGLQVSFTRLFRRNHGPSVQVVYSDHWKRYLEIRSDGRLYWKQREFYGAHYLDTSRPLGPIIHFVEHKPICLRRVENPLYISGRQIIKQRQPEAFEKHIKNNWAAFERSTLVSWVLPDFALQP